jgi:hypothetical protein
LGNNGREGGGLAEGAVGGGVGVWGESLGLDCDIVVVVVGEESFAEVDGLAVGIGVQSVNSDVAENENQSIDRHAFSNKE